MRTPPGAEIFAEKKSSSQCFHRKYAKKPQQCQCGHAWKMFRPKIKFQSMEKMYQKEHQPVGINLKIENQEKNMGKIKGKKTARYSSRSSANGLVTAMRHPDILRQLKLRVPLCCPGTWCHPAVTRGRVRLHHAADLPRWLIQRTRLSRSTMRQGLAVRRRRRHHNFHIHRSAVHLLIRRTRRPRRRDIPQSTGRTRGIWLLVKPRLSAAVNRRTPAVIGVIPLHGGFIIVLGGLGNLVGVIGGGGGRFPGPDGSFVFVKVILIENQPLLLRRHFPLLPATIPATTETENGCHSQESEEDEPRADGDPNHGRGGGDGTGGWAGAALEFGRGASLFDGVEIIGGVAEFAGEALGTVADEAGSRDGGEVFARCTVVARRVLARVGVAGLAAGSVEAARTATGGVSCRSGSGVVVVLGVNAGAAVQARRHGAVVTAGAGGLGCLGVAVASSDLAGGPGETDGTCAWNNKGRN